MIFKNQIPLSVPADKAWELVGNQFGNIGEWVTSLSWSKLEGDLGIGASRVCQANGFGPFAPAQVKEKLVQFSPEEHRFTYVATDGIPKIVKSAQNTWWVDAIDDNNCTVNFRAVIEFVWYVKPISWLILLGMQRDTKKFSQELKHVIEKNKIHPRKLAMQTQS